VESRENKPAVLPREVRGLVLAFFLLSSGGLLLHLRIHPPAQTLFHWIPAVFGAVNTVVVPLLFARASTVAWAFALTWATVLAGTVGMAYFSLTSWDSPVTLASLIFDSTLADILILWAKIPLAWKILAHYELPGEGTGRRGCDE
jgi:hypothetical protein